MFQITRRADYALRVMVELGLFFDGKPIPTQIIAESTGVPSAFMRKIVAELAKSGLMQTIKGPSGGLVLNRSLEDISVLQIFEAVEGPFCLNMCLIGPGLCKHEMTCPSYSLFAQLQADIVLRLRSTALATLVKEAALLRENPRLDAPSVVPANI